jgi:apolipoprotein D and lipocalin family protein
VPRFFLLLAVLVFAGCGTDNPPLPTVAQVDLSRYAGRWYEIARLPNFFQKDGARATADYTVQDDGSVKVRNTELRADGGQKAVEGRATAVEGSGNARLQVRFDGLAGLAPVAAEGNYWIIGLEPDYSVALVGTPDRKFLWLLARTPKLPASARDRHLARARELGFPTEKILTAMWP